MTISREDLVRQFGAIIERGHAALFVGAGMSLNAGLPNWSALMRQPRREAAVPTQVTDLPLVAEYYTHEVAGGPDRLKAHVLRVTAEKARAVRPTRSHRLLSDLPITETWTTNYDDLLERTKAGAVVVSREEDLVVLRSSPGSRIFKMHGGLVSRPDGEEFIDPVITRTDYESYTTSHPRLWALLTSTFLTRSMLFLGFSFDDPNLEVMLRLARSLDSPRTHFTVMKVPDRPIDIRLHKLRVSDLERSAISVHEVDSYGDLEPLLEELVRRTRDAAVFLSGSERDGAVLDFTDLCRAIGSRLAELPISLQSLAGPAAGKISHAFARVLCQDGAVPAAQRIRFYYEQSGGAEKQYHASVIGTRIYTDTDASDLRGAALRQCRAMILLGGGGRTQLEVAAAEQQKIPVIPVAASGGFALQYWKDHRIHDSGLRIPQAHIEAAARHWAALGDDEINAVALAVQRLTSWANYLE